jgi:hypothetical protein
MKTIRNSGEGLGCGFFQLDFTFLSLSGIMIVK